ncbi:hypothetical protein QYG89_11230 [Bacillus sp. B190/17]|uniref:Spore coat protein B n=1 Tax=Bacillus lumedeiriae TaxID=3058829 RepID=A0ABW8I9T1_9BACI
MTAITQIALSQAAINEKEQQARANNIVVFIFPTTKSPLNKDMGGKRKVNKETMSSLIGKVIKINRGGHDSRVGILLAVEEDYFVLLTEEDGVLYYKNHHVKSLTDNTKGGLPFNLGIPEGFTYAKGKTFSEMMKDLKYSWVTINRGGHEKYEGVLEAVNDDYVTMVINEEIIRIASFHIRNLSYGLMVEAVEQNSTSTSDTSSSSSSSSSSSAKASSSSSSSAKASSAESTSQKQDDTVNNR